MLTYTKNLKIFQKKNSYGFLKICRILSLQKLVTKINSMGSVLVNLKTQRRQPYWKAVLIFFFLFGKLDLGQSSFSTYFVFIAQFSEWVLFPVHGTITQHWISLLKNRASTEKIILTVKESCQWMLNNHAMLNNCTSDCLLIMSVIVKESCQRLLNNHKGNWLLKNCAIDSWTVVSVTFERCASCC